MLCFVRRLLLAAAVAVCGVPGAFAQWGDGRHRVPLPVRDSTALYVSDGDSTVLFYEVQPARGRLRGVLLLLPATGEATASVFAANEALLRSAADSGLVVAVPSLNYNLALDGPALRLLNAVVADIRATLHPPRNGYVLGGFSLGGTNAVRYCELAYEDSTQTGGIRPAAVYGVDPPLDWARSYHSFERTVAKAFSEPAVREAEAYLEKLNTQFGGPPEAVPAVYARQSPYTRQRADGGNARFLRTVPLRLYADPDVDWWLANRRVDFYDMNAPDQTALVNYLHGAGNDRAAFVNALGRGYRPDGRRHPHSWSLVDGGDCVAWLLRCIAPAR